MDLLTVTLTTVLSLIILFVLTKIMGNKQISQLTMFDYITGITIGSIAAEMATELETPERPVLAMVIYGLAAVVISFCSSKSNRLRGFFNGKPIILMQNGKIDRAKMRKARLDINELLTMARLAGYFDLSRVQTAVFEQNGNVSFLPKAQYRPSTPDDFKIPVSSEEILYNVIVDGNIMPHELALAAKDEHWLNEQLKTHHIAAKDIMLATLDHNGALQFILKR